MQYELKTTSQSKTYPAPADAPLSAAAPAAEHILTAIESTASDTKPTTTQDAADVQDESSKPQRSKLRLTFILLALFLSLFVAALDATIVATAVPVIAHELNSAVGYAWIGGAYLIANAIAGPIWAKLSDIWGRKVVMLAAVAIFFASSAICATAKTMRVLIAGRALQGTAGGGLILLVHVVISDLFSLRLRSLFMGITEGVWAFAGGVGPPLGGVFAGLVSWRWCFYINLPICGVAFALLLVVVAVKHEQTSFRTGIMAMDWLGMASFLAFALMVLLGLDFGGDVFAWDSAKVICLIVIGVIMLGVFVYCEAKFAKYPLIPVSLFKNRSNLAAMSVGGLHGFCFIPGEYFVPTFLQSVKQQSPVRSGVLLIPLIVATAVTGIATGVFIHRFGRYRELIWTGSAILCLGNGLFIMLGPESSIGTFIGVSVVIGLGSGMLFEPPLIAVQSSSEQKNVATATSTFAFCRSIAIAISIIVGGVVFSNSMDAQAGRLQHSGLPMSVVEALSGKEAAANIGIGHQITDAAQKLTIEQAFSWSIRNMWIMYTALSALGFVAALFVGKTQLSKEHVETVTGIKSEKKVPT